jgi:glycosyltransferase involved in cell wall biosynthesis
MHLAWFSPMPPVPSGIADCSADLIAELGKRHTIDVYVHETSSSPAMIVTRGADVYSAHDFVWRHRLKPYDLPVYQLGNSSHHDYIWPYLFRYPGLTVLHDAHLHHARAAALLRTNRPSDFRAEFAANHPDVSADVAELAIAGFDNQLYYEWPMTRLVVEASRLTAVHTAPLRRQLQEELPRARITSIRLSHGAPVSDEQVRLLRSRVRSQYGIASDAVAFGVFGGLTPDKRLPQILDALNAIVPYVPSAHLLLAGAAPRHYDLAADVNRRGLDGRVTITGYLRDDADLTACISACDVSLNLRWPTAREMSGPWLRALAAGRPTIVIDLAHMVDVPALDPRTWKMNAMAAGDWQLAAGKDRANREPRTANRDEPHPGSRTTNRGSTPAPGSWLLAAGTDQANRESRTANREPVTVAIDILDEDHSLRLAMRRLATDPELRASLGEVGRRYWHREHSMPRMVEDYERVLAEAAAAAAPHVELPSHLVTGGERVLDQVLVEFSLGALWE